MNFLVFGATGLVGSSLSTQLSKEHNVTVALRDVSKLENTSYIKRAIDYENFNSFENLKYDGIYCCLGTTIKSAGSKKGFRRVDLDYVLMCYQYALKTNANFFCVISALGANKNSKIFYNQIKGKMEDSLDGNIKTYIVRPSLLIGDRKEFRLAEKISLTLTAPFTKLLTKTLGKYAPIKVEDVARSMIDLTLERGTPSGIEYLVK